MTTRYLLTWEHFCSTDSIWRYPYFSTIRACQFKTSFKQRNWTEETNLKTLQKNNEIKTCGQCQTLTLCFRWIMVNVMVSRAYLFDIISQINCSNVCWASMELRSCICNLRQMIPYLFSKFKIPIFDYSQTVRILSY